MLGRGYAVTQHPHSGVSQFVNKEAVLGRVLLDVSLSEEIADGSKEVWFWLPSLCLNPSQIWRELEELGAGIGLLEGVLV